MDTAFFLAIPPDFFLNLHCSFVDGYRAASLSMISPKGYAILAGLNKAILELPLVILDC